MPKHVCMSEPLNQHVSINTMNNTCENVWLSPKKRWKYCTLPKPSHFPIILSSPFLRVNRVPRHGEPYQKSGLMGVAGKAVIAPALNSR